MKIQTKPFVITAIIGITAAFVYHEIHVVPKSSGDRFKPFTVYKDDVQEKWYATRGDGSIDTNETFTSYERARAQADQWSNSLVVFRHTFGLKEGVPLSDETRRLMMVATNVANLQLQLQQLWASEHTKALAGVSNQVEALATNFDALRQDVIKESLKMEEYIALSHHGIDTNPVVGAKR